MPHAQPSRHARSSARGVTLIELMVGMVIGLLAVLVIAQVALLFEGQKRSTTGGSDAQVNGALSLQMLQRDLQIDESALTGESVPVEKDVEVLEVGSLLADRANMAYSSSLILSYSSFIC